MNDVDNPKATAHVRECDAAMSQRFGSLDVELFMSNKETFERVVVDTGGMFSEAITPFKLYPKLVRVDRLHLDYPRVALRIDGKKIGRNDPCPCGSGLKFKRCTCEEYHEARSSN